MAVVSEYAELLGAARSSQHTDYGSCEVWQWENVLVSEVAGRFKIDFGEAVIAGFDEAARFGSVVAFHDWEDVHSYDVVVQARFTTHGALNVNNAKLLQFLASHGVIRAAISTTNLVYRGKLQVVSTPTFRMGLSDMLARR